MALASLCPTALFNTIQLILWYTVCNHLNTSSEEAVARKQWHCQIQSHWYSVCTQEWELHLSGSKPHRGNLKRTINSLPPGIEEEDYSDKVLGEGSDILLHPLPYYFFALVKKLLATKMHCLDKSSLCLGDLVFSKCYMCPQLGRNCVFILLWHWSHNFESH